MSDDVEPLPLFDPPATDRPIPDFAPAQEDRSMIVTGYARGRTDRGRAAPAQAACRSCKAPMLWVTFPSGKRNPLDAEPSAAGNIVVYEHEAPNGEVWRCALLLSNEELVREAREAGIPLYLTHFKTCPDADEHRREARRRGPDG